MKKPKMIFNVIEFFIYTVMFFYIEIAVTYFFLIFTEKRFEEHTKYPEEYFCKLLKTVEILLYRDISKL